MKARFFVARMPAFFFPVRTRSSTPRRHGSPRRRHGCWPSTGRRREPFFFGVGRDPQTRFAGGPDEGGRLAGAFPFLLFPPFWGVFPGQATRVAVLEEALRNEKAWKQGFQARCRTSFSFPPSPCPPVAPQAEAIALRREVERLQAHPSAVEIDRLRFRARPRRRLRSVAVAEDPLAVVFPLFFFRSIPRRSVSRHDLPRHRPGKSARARGLFFFGFFFPVPSGHLGVPSRHFR